jgi:pimeloyl-ACP methyl ester carboxylesterase
MDEMSQAPLHHVTIHGHEVSYRMGGEGSVVLLIHGMAGSSRTWKDVTDLLVREHTVIAPDLLGHGESAKPMGDYSLGAFASGLRDLLGVIGVERATVVGQSLGGGVAMQLAYQHPEVVERLVLVCSGGLGREVSWMLRALTLPGAELIMPVLFPRFLHDRGNDVSRVLHERGIRAPHVAEMWRAYASLTGAENRGAFLRTLRSVVDPGGQTVSALDRIYLAGGLPTLIIWGDEDPIIPIEHGHAAHAAIAGSRLEIMEGCGHFPHVEEPRRFVEVLEDFLATTEPADDGPEGYRDLLLAHSEAPSPKA